MKQKHQIIFKKIIVFGKIWCYIQINPDVLGPPV